MQLFNCSCNSRPALFFESTSCTTCGRLTGYSDHLNRIVAFENDEEQGFFKCAEDAGASYYKCQNNEIYGACNGMVRLNPEKSKDSQHCFCFACHFNTTIPDLDVNNNLNLWRKLEVAKRRTLFTIVSLGLPLQSKYLDPENGLSFSFMADKEPADNFQSPLPDHEPVLTGHSHGEITINLKEADDIARTMTRIEMGESYRTLLGHFRHETGHFFWDQLVEPNPQRLKACQALFGDAKLDYGAALDRHYQQGPPENWHETFISAYASMHPWEDWAETWAHYLHIIDTLETAQSFGLHLKSGNHAVKSTPVADITLPQDMNVYAHQTSIDDIVKAWMNFSVALNSLNRSMGLPDPYPFVLYPVIQSKIKLVHQIVHDLPVDHITTDSKS